MNWPIKKTQKKKKEKGKKKKMLPDLMFLNRLLTEILGSARRRRIPSSDVLDDACGVVSVRSVPAAMVGGGGLNQCRADRV